VHARRAHTVSRRLRDVNFPEVKTFDQIEWAALKGPSRPNLNELATCHYIDSCELGRLPIVRRFRP
jgi:hypothetical protein